MSEVVADSVYTFDQLQGTLYVHVAVCRFQNEFIECELVSIEHFCCDERRRRVPYRILWEVSSLFTSLRGPRRFLDSTLELDSTQARPGAHDSASRNSLRSVLGEWGDHWCLGFVTY